MKNNDNSNTNENFIYPIFVRDQGGWIDVVNNCNDLNSFEAIDVRDNEFEYIWDAEGNRLEMYMGDNEYDFRLKSLGINQKKELMDAIFHDGELYYKKLREKIPETINFNDFNEAIDFYNFIHKIVETEIAKEKKLKKEKRKEKINTFLRKIKKKVLFWS